jgi:hypothetical protein
MKETLIMAAIAVVIIPALRAGIKTYRARGKFDGQVVAEILETGLDGVEKKIGKKK